MEMKKGFLCNRGGVATRQKQECGCKSEQHNQGVGSGVQAAYKKY